MDDSASECGLKGVNDAGKGAASGGEICVRCCPMLLLCRKSVRKLDCCSPLLHPLVVRPVPAAHPTTHLDALHFLLRPQQLILQVALLLLDVLLLCRQGQAGGGGGVGGRPGGQSAAAGGGGRWVDPSPQQRAARGQRSRCLGSRWRQSPTVASPGGAGCCLAIGLARTWISTNSSCRCRVFNRL